MANPPARILITRPDRQARRFADACRQRFGDRVALVLSPVLEIEMRPPTRDAKEYAGVILTSENAVPALERMAGTAGKTAYCVGERTAEMARRAGLATEVAGDDAQALGDALIATPPDGRLLYLRGETVRTDLARRLSENGVPTDEDVVYAQTERPLTEDAKRLLAGGAPVIVPLFSPRSAEILAAQVNAARAPLVPVALSSAVAAAWPGPVAAAAIAQQPGAAAMIDAIETVLGSDSGC